MEEIGSTEAVIYKIQTMVDGGCRITLDVGEDSKDIINKLFSKKMSGDNLVFVAFVNAGN